MKLKRLILATGIAVAFVAMLSFVAPAFAGSGYYHVEHGDSGTDFICKTYVDCYYNTPSYTLDQVASTKSYAANGFWGTGITVNSWQLEETTVNIMAYVQATYDPLFGDTWTGECQSWCYPGYTQQPTGGFYQTW